ncbi:unnamed protein product, partial [Symbiodinium pilosum]
EYDSVDADVAHQLGTFVTKSFKDSQERASCLSCSTRPKSYIKSLTVYERDPNDRRYRMTVDLDHDRDTSYTHVWYNKEKQWHSLPSALQAFPKRRSVFMGPRILDDEANVADFREPDVVSVGHSLAVQLNGSILELADVALWEEGSAAAHDEVPLEFLFTGAPDGINESQISSALTQKLADRLQEEQRVEFRSQLKKRQESSLRRRKAGPDEGGDEAEETWRRYLHKPAPEVKLKVHSVFDAGTRVRKVLGCRVLVSPEAALELGKICFRSIFESEEEERERLRQLHWYE